MCNYNELPSKSFYNDSLILPAEVPQSPDQQHSCPDICVTPCGSGAAPMATGTWEETAERKWSVIHSTVAPGSPYINSFRRKKSSSRAFTSKGPICSHLSVAFHSHLEKANGQSPRSMWPLGTCTDGPLSPRPLACLNYGLKNIQKYPMHDHCRLSGEASEEAPD